MGPQALLLLDPLGLLVVHLEARLEPGASVVNSHLVPPDPLPVVHAEGVEDDGDGQGEDEHTEQGGQAAE